MTDTIDQTGTPPRRPARPEQTPEEQRASLIRLLVIVATVIGISVFTGAFPTVVVVIALLVMIMLHEFGHFVTAKAAGMKVTEFFLGFGPRLWSIRKGETEYGVKAIPAGGYVRIIGMHNLEQVDPVDEPRTYRQKPYWRRMTVALAGSTMHFLIAFVLLWTLNGAVGLLDFDKPLPKVGAISKLQSGQSPAEKAGFKLGDEIVSVDGRAVHEWQDLPDYIRPRPDQPVTFVVRRGGKTLTLTATPVDRRTVRTDSPSPTSPDEPQGFIGIGPSFEVARANPVTATGRAGKDLWLYMETSAKALGSFFTPSSLHKYTDQLTNGPRSSSADRPTTTAEPENRLLSPVGFVRVASQAANTGLRQVLILLVLINVFVGIFNLVPLLPLDGGHVALATYERIRSRRGKPYHADVAKLMPLTYAVVFIIVTLGVTALWLDIVKPVANPFQ